FAVAPSSLRGVLMTNGVYDENAMHHARKGAPTFLVLSAHDDPPVSAQSSRAFARALERAGAKVHRYHLGSRDARALREFDGERNDVADLALAFARGEPPPGGPDSAWAVADAWDADAPLSSEPFWRDERLVARHPIDERFRAHLRRIF